MLESGVKEHASFASRLIQEKKSLAKNKSFYRGIKRPFKSLRFYIMQER